MKSSGRSPAQRVQPEEDEQRSEGYGACEDEEARPVLVTKDGIKVISFVHTERGLVDVDEMTPEEKVRAATEIRLKWLNELYRGKAVFEAEGDGLPRADTASGTARHLPLEGKA